MPKSQFQRPQLQNFLKRGQLQTPLQGTAFSGLYFKPPSLKSCIRLICVQSMFMLVRMINVVHHLIDPGTSVSQGTGPSEAKTNLPLAF